MSEYKPPIRIDMQDPLCSASAIGNTVIGILFEKTGAEIKNAINARMAAVTGKIKEYEGTAKRIDEFINKKRLVLREMDLFQTHREDERRALLRPVEREIDDAKRIVEGLMRKRDDVSYDFSEDTRKDLGKKAVVFDAGFDEFQKEFDLLDEFLQKEKEVVQGVYEVNLRGDSTTGVQGCTGAQGLYGAVVREPARGVGYGDSVEYRVARRKGDEGDEEQEETAEDKAIARMHTLRGILEKYMKKVGEIRRAIRALKEERRRLQLIGNNIGSDRVYKLDINKLSAFGFENIE